MLTGLGLRHDIVFASGFVGKAIALAILLGGLVLGGFLLGANIGGPAACAAQPPGHVLQRQPSDDDWVNRVAPGIRLIGRPNTSAIHLDRNTFTMTSDGRILIGCRGRRLVFIDWETQQWVREIELPIRAGSGHVQRLLFTKDDRNLLVVVSWSGRPYEADDGTDLDEEDFIQYFQEYPPNKFRGTRLLVYDERWNLQHDLELQTDVNQNSPYIRPGSQASFDNFFLLPDDRTLLALGHPVAKVIDILRAEVIAQQPGISSGWLVSDDELVFGHPLKTWNITENTVQPGDPLDLPETAQLRVVDPTIQRLVYFDRATKETVLRDMSTGSQQVISREPHASTGIFSSDGQLYVFPEFIVPNKSSRINAYDIIRQEFIVKADLDGFLGQYIFRPEHYSLLVRGWNESSIVEVPIDQNSAESIQQAVNRLPNSGRIVYTDGDRALFLAQGPCWLDPQDGSILGRSFLGASFSGHESYSPTEPRQLRVINETPEYEIAISDLAGEKYRTLYKIAPSRALGTFKSVLGVRNQQPIGIHEAYLGFDPQGQVVRNLYIENGERLRLRITDVTSGRKVSEQRLNPEMETLQPARGTVSPDGRRVAIAAERTVEILDAETGESIRQLTVPQVVQQVVLDRKGEYVAVALGVRAWLSTNQICVYRVSDGERVFSQRGKELLGFGFQPGRDRFYLLTSGSENELRFYDRDTWALEWQHATAHSPAYGMAMSSDGNEVAIGLRDSRVEIWRLSDLQLSAQ